MNHLQEKYQKQIEQMIEAWQALRCAWLWRGSGGNASYRVDDNVVLITPHRHCEAQDHL